MSKRWKTNHINHKYTKISDNKNCCNCKYKVVKNDWKCSTCIRNEYGLEIAQYSDNWKNFRDKKEGK